jgi:hypothetical protein
MAKRKSTREAHAPRNPRSQHRPRPDPASDAVAASTPSAPTADSAIEVARSNLMRARAVLDCTRFVLLYDDQLEVEQRPSFSDALDVAVDLVAEVIDTLDRVNLRPGKASA